MAATPAIRWRLCGIPHLEEMWGTRGWFGPKKPQGSTLSSLPRISHPGWCDRRSDSLTTNIGRGFAPSVQPMYATSANMGHPSRGWGLRGNLQFAHDPLPVPLDPGHLQALNTAWYTGSQSPLATMTVRSAVDGWGCGAPLRCRRSRRRLRRSPASTAE